MSEARPPVGDAVPPDVARDPAGPAPYWHPYAAGLTLGVVLLGSFLVTGHGLGASGGLTRVLALGLDLVAPAHVDRTREWAALAGGGANPLDAWIIWMMAGSVLGGFVSGWRANRVRVEVFHGPRISPATRLVAAFAGGVLVGLGARFARGCTSGQALSGGAVLAVGSWAFMIMVFGGGYLLAPFVRKLWR